MNNYKFCCDKDNDQCDQMIQINNIKDKIENNPIKNVSGTYQSIRSINSDIINNNLISSHDDNEIANEVINHICKVSFGSIINQNCEFVQLLKDAIINKFINGIRNQSYYNININNCSLIYNELISKPTKSKYQSLNVNDSIEIAVYKEKQLCFEISFVLLFYLLRPEITLLLYDINTFKSKYDIICNQSTNHEIEKLLHFRNMMTIALQIIPPYGKKGYLLDMITRIVEGYKVKYITGSGASVRTVNRLKILEIESKLPIYTRKKRLRNEDSTIERK